MTVDSHTARASVPVPLYWTEGAAVYTETFASGVGSWAPGTPNSTISNDGAGHLRLVATDFDNTPRTFVAYTLAGMTVGAPYRIVARVATANAGNAAQRLVRVGAGGSFAPYVANHALTAPEPWQDLAFTFYANSTTMSLQIEANELYNSPDLRVDRVDVYRAIPRYSLELDIEDANVTLDESWSPYVQASIVCPMPDPAVFAQLDPTRNPAPRVNLTLSQRFGTSEPVSALSATFAPGSNLADLSFRYDGVNGGLLVAALSADYGTPYNSFGIRPSTVKRLDLAIRSREVDRDTGRMTLTLASDEGAMQDAARVSSDPISPSGTNLVSAVELALSRIGAHLTDALDATGLDPAALVWEPGVSAWDYVAPLVEAAGRRLWCDEGRRWHLSDPLQPSSGGVTVLPTAKRIEDTTDRDGDWYDGVVVEYRWTDAGGVEQVRYDIAGGDTSTRVLHVSYDRPWAAAGAAAAILARSTSRASSVALTAVSDYGATPGDAFPLPALDGSDTVGMVSSVAYRIPGYDMTLRTRGLTAAPEHSWLADAPDVSWQMVPVGIDWTEDV